MTKCLNNKRIHSHLQAVCKTCHNDVPKYKIKIQI
jgi:hypothetical protein